MERATNWVPAPNIIWESSEIFQHFSISCSTSCTEATVNLKLANQSTAKPPGTLSSVLLKYRVSQNRVS